MLPRFLQHLRYLLTALGLLTTVVIAAELFLRSSRQVPPAAVAPDCDDFDQSQLLPSATLHHQMRPLAQVAGPDGRIRFRTNSLGLRGPEPDIPPPEDTLRILLLGDETVLGPWLPDPYTLPARLERDLKDRLDVPVEVVNGGVPGAAPVLSSLMWDHVLQKLEPDIVILHVDMSDVADETFLRRFLRQDGSRRVCIHPCLAAGPPSDSVLALLRRSALFRTVGCRLLTPDTPTRAGDRFQWTRSAGRSVSGQVRHMMESVRVLHESLRAEDRILVLGTSPVPWQVLSMRECGDLMKRFGITDAAPVTDDVPFKTLTAWGQQNDVPVCSSITEFRRFSSPDKLFRREIPRLSKYGTALYARLLARTVLQIRTMTARRSGRSL